MYKYTIYSSNEILYFFIKIFYACNFLAPGVGIKKIVPVSHPAIHSDTSNIHPHTNIRKLTPVLKTLQALALVTIFLKNLKK